MSNFKSALIELAKWLQLLEDGGKVNWGCFFAPKARVFGCLVALALAGPLGKAASNLCPDADGSCDINHPVYVNVYWDASVAQWNADAAANDPSATVERLDALTAAICNGAYFSQLYQYDVQSCNVLPSIVTNLCGPHPANIHAAHDQIGAFAACIFVIHPGMDPKRTILNVFLPPQTVPLAPANAIDGLFYPEFCDSSAASTAVGEHGQYGSSPVGATFIPTNSACTKTIGGIKGIGAISATLTHEMVEATTDPNVQSITGWKGLDGEIGDECQKPPSAAPIPSSFLSAFLNGRVSSYYSNKANGCTDGISTAATFIPVITSIAACGSGAQMRISMTGNAGGVPWDLTSTAGGSKTLFLQVAVKGKKSFNAGGFWNFPSDSIGLGPITWKNGPGGDSIVINGFDNFYGVAPGAVRSGDNITVTVSSQVTGQSTTSNITAPSPSKVTSFAVTPLPVYAALPIYIGDTTDVRGRVFDAGGCPVEGVDVQLSAADGKLNPASDATDSDGNFWASYVPGGVAGIHSLKVVFPIAGTTTVAVHPVALSLDRTIGDVAGGQPITITGAGFGPNVTQVHFKSPNGSADGKAVSVTDSGTFKFLTPPSPIAGMAPGVVDVIVTVNGLDSAALSYEYILPNQPVMRFTYQCKSPNPLEIDAYNADGSMASEQVTMSAGYPAFWDSLGQKLLPTTVVSPGTIISFESASALIFGPITATPSANPKLAVTKTFPVSISDCLKQFTYLYPVVVAVKDWLGPDPPDNTPIASIISKNGLSFAWVNTRNLKDASGYLTVQNSLAQNAARAATTSLPAIAVRSLGRRELASLARQNNVALGRKDTESTRIRLLGPNFSIRGSTSSALPATSMISFLLPEIGPVANYCILRASAGGAWIEMPSSLTRTDGRGLVRSKVPGPGIYALARVEH